MLLPFDFQKFFVKNIQKIKNGLRVQCYAPHHRRYRGRASPQGEATKWLTIFFAFFSPKRKSEKGKPWNKVGNYVNESSLV